MVVINAKVVMGDVLKALDHAQSQVPFALAKGLTDTAKDVKEAEAAHMRAVFKAPTPYTMRSLYMRAATKARQQAEVWLKDSERPTHYLLPQITGGGRALKRFEQRLVMHGLMRSDQRAVPAAGARLDAYGNMSRGQIVQVLSQLRTAVVSGDFSNATNSKRSRAKRAAVAYFVSHGKGSRRHGFQGRRGRGAMYEQHLPAGVWARYAFAAGTAVKPVLLFVSRTNYAPRFRFDEVAEQTIKRQLPVRMTHAVNYALATARLNHQGGLL